MPIPTVIGDLSATAADNSPANTESPADGDDYLRAHAAFIKQAYNGELTAFVKVTSDGRLYGTALHNNSGAVTGTTNQYVASGTYTPTLTNTTNVSASTANICQWIRVGNVVHVGGSVSIDPTAASVLTELNVSLPIASSITSDVQVRGTCNRNPLASSLAPAGVVRGDAAADNAVISFINDTDLSNRGWSFTFTYLVL